MADLTIPAAGPVADRLPGQTLRLRVPAPPFRGQHRILLGLGEMTDLVTGLVTMIPQYHSRWSELRVLISASVPGAVFGLSHAQATRPSSAMRRPVQMIYLLIDAATTQAAG